MITKSDANEYMTMEHSIEESEKNLNILLVEDNLADARILQIELGSLEDTHYNIHHVENMQQAAEALEEKQFDIVLTDLSLPDSDGYESIQRLMEIDKNLPIVVLSGQDDEEFSLKAVQMGAQDYLIKGIGDGHLFNRSIRYAIERKRTERNMQYLAHYDSLTGLANRVLFRERLEYAVARAKRTQAQIALLFVDLDRFKQINDTLGHDAGDLLLIEVAKRISSCLRKEDTIARLGGDEFVVVLEDLKKMNDAAFVANKIINVLSKPFEIVKQKLYVTPSIGITIYPNDNLNTNELLKNADAAMYLAKEKGRNRYQFYTEDMNKESKKRLDIETKLRSALENEEFILFFQPKFNLGTTVMSGAEALIRWQHPEMGMVQPMDFVPLAEETGLIVPMGEWVIQKSCECLSNWKKMGFKPFRVAVNLSPRQFHNQEIVDFILDTLIEYNIKPEEFEVEITEGLLMEDTETTIELLNKLKAWGLHISIDDFGTGYCSLGYLRKFPIDTLKIDRSFVQDIMSEPDDAAITEAIIALGRSLNLSVTAEGVEDEYQLKFLREHGCHEGQGYFYSKPLDVDSLTEFMRQTQTIEDSATTENSPEYPDQCVLQNLAR